MGNTNADHPPVAEIGDVQTILADRRAAEALGDGDAPDGDALDGTKAPYADRTTPTTAEPPESACAQRVANSPLATRQGAAPARDPEPAPAEAVTGEDWDVTIDGSGLPIPDLEGLVDEFDRQRVKQQLFGGSSHPFELGRYLVMGTLGRGGCGSVFKAFDPTLDRRVALKVLHKELDDRHTTRLLREAQAMAKLSHPHVVHVYEVGEVDGRTFVAMELVRGQTLQEWMHQDPRPSWRECVEVFMQVGSGLAAAHGRGLVHRDFKPSNAIIDNEGRARVLDFGLARLVGTLETEERTLVELRASNEHLQHVPLDTSLTNTGTVLGTPAYMPPEQMMGTEADTRSDQFSFCVALYEAVYGERPFAGDSIQALMVSMIRGELRPVPKRSRVPARLRAVLLRGLAIRSEDRWPSMEALLGQLRRLLVPRRQRWLALGAGLVMGMGLFGAGLTYGADMEQRDHDAHEQPQQQQQPHDTADPSTHPPP